VYVLVLVLEFEGLDSGIETSHNWKLNQLMNQFFLLSLGAFSSFSKSLWKIDPIHFKNSMPHPFS
jgi:hypothetical protein